MAESITAVDPALYNFGSTSRLFAGLKSGLEESPSLWWKVRNGIEFIDGAWAQDIGKDWYAAKKAGQTFNFWENYHDYMLNREITAVGKEGADKAAQEILKANESFLKSLPKDIKKFTPEQKTLYESIQKQIEKSASDSIRKSCGANKIIMSANTDKTEKGIGKCAQEISRNVTPKKAGIFSKIFGCIKKIPGAKFLGKHFGPILMLAFTAKEMYDEAKNGGGIGGMLKAAAKGAIGQLGYVGGTLLATAVLGCTGILWPLLLGMGGAMLAGWTATKVLGKSSTEKIEEEQALAQQQGKQVQGQENQYYAYGPNGMSTMPFRRTNYSGPQGAMFRQIDESINRIQNSFNNRYDDMPTNMAAPF